MPPLPNHREELFAIHCASGLPNTEAYQTAGFKPHTGNAARMRAKDSVRARITELQSQIIQKVQKTQVVAIKQATLTKQFLIEALLENLEVGLGRRPVRMGPAAAAVEQYVYRGDVANNAIKMAGSEVGLFSDRTEVTHRMNFDDLSDEQLLVRLRDETEALLLEKRALGLAGEEEGGNKDDGQG